MMMKLNEKPLTCARISSQKQFSQVNVRFEAVDARQLTDKVERQIEFLQRFAAVQVFDSFDIIYGEIEVFEFFQFVKIF